MKKTVKDISKLTSQGVSYLKAGVYYLAVPIVLGLGLQTVDFSRMFAPGNWSTYILVLIIPLILQTINHINLYTSIRNHSITLLLSTSTCSRIQDLASFYDITKSIEGYFNKSFGKIKSHWRQWKSFLLGQTNLLLY